MSKQRITARGLDSVAELMETHPNVFHALARETLLELLHLGRRELDRAGASFDFETRLLELFPGADIRWGEGDEQDMVTVTLPIKATSEKIREPTWADLDESLDSYVVRRHYGKPIGFSTSPEMSRDGATREIPSDPVTPEIPEPEEIPEFPGSM